MTVFHVALACGIAVALAVRATGAQTGRAPRIAEGRVLRPSSSGRPLPVAGQWIVLHRVGSDRAGPLDSMRSAPDGRFRFRYRPTGDADALYFVSARYRGIAYFSPPLRADVVRGDDADVMVYDTTSDTTALRVQGRHLVLSAPRGARREVAEIFEIENEDTRTVVAPDSVSPVWSTRLPAEAESASVAPGDVSAAAVVFRSNRADVFAPISPGVRQLVLTYLLPASAFPVSRPLERPASVLEVLLEEPRAEVEGARLAEVAPATIDGRTFRRFLAQDVPASEIVRFAAPPPVAQNQAAMRVLAVVVALAMVGALAAWFVRGRTLASTPHPAPAPSTQEHLIAELAALDARFEREKPTSPDARAAYERDRAQLKDRVARALAEEKKPA